MAQVESDQDEWVVTTREPLPIHELRHSLVRYYQGAGRHMYVLRGLGSQIRSYATEHGVHSLAPNRPMLIDVYPGATEVGLGTGDASAQPANVHRGQAPGDSAGSSKGTGASGEGSESSPKNSEIEQLRERIRQHMAQKRAEANARQWGASGAAGRPLKYQQVPREPRNLASFVPADPLRPASGYPGYQLRTYNETGTEQCRSNANTDGRVGYSTGSFSWGIDRVDQDATAVDYNFCAGYNGTSVHAYIFDTGINPHNTFGARVRQDWSWYTPDMVPVDDKNGHGTHVAGLVGSAVYGTGTSVVLHAMQVMDEDGYGTFASISAGLMWVYDNAELPAVINMSLGGPGYTESIAQLVQDLFDDLGIITIVSAGNAGSDACSFFPAAIPVAVTVAASQYGDYLASFSNRGTCVDVVAPGNEIISAYGSADSAIILSGTSMSAPVVTGLMTLVQQKISIETGAVASLYDLRGSTATYHTYYGTRAYGEYQRMLDVNGTQVPNPVDVINLLLHDSDYGSLRSLPSGTPNVIPLSVRTEEAQYPVPEAPPAPTGANRTYSEPAPVWAALTLYAILLAVTGPLLS